MFIDYFYRMGNALVYAASELVAWFARPIKDVALLPFGSWLNDKILDLVSQIPVVGEFYDMSVLEAILGPGMFALLVVILIKWVLDFVL